MVRKIIEFTSSFPGEWAIWLTPLPLAKGSEMQNCQLSPSWLARPGPLLSLPPLLSPLLPSMPALPLTTLTFCRGDAFLERGLHPLQKSSTTHTSAGSETPVPLAV